MYLHMIGFAAANFCLEKLALIKVTIFVLLVLRHGRVFIYVNWENGPSYFFKN